MPDCDKKNSIRLTASSHIPVLLEKVNEFMDPSPGKNFIDLTTGPGSMSRALLERNAPDGRVLSIDCDPRTREEQKANLSEFGHRSVRRYANFSDVRAIADEEGFREVDGILGDLDVSSAMLDDPRYGMSFRHDSPIDMKFDPNLEVSGYDLVNSLSEEELKSMLKEMDEARFAGRIARAIVRARSEKPVETTGQLAEIVSNAIPRRFHPRRIHPATKTFLSIRERVNSERESLEKCLADCIEILRAGGVLVIICFNSFEDRIVKAMYAGNRERWERLTKKALRPAQEEITANPRSRSARLRAYKKIA